MSTLADLSKRFEFNLRTLGMLVEDFEAADWARPPAPDGGNTAHWILGHVALSRRILARRLGEDLPEEDWEALFATHATPEGTKGYPAPRTLLEDLGESGRRIGRSLAGKSAEEGAEEWGGSFPDGGTTIADGARFLHFHEAYHLGQIGMLRRVCGKPKLF